MLEIPRVLDKKKLPSLDGLRAVSIMFVIFSHIIYQTQFDLDTNFGAIGVEIFFVISGFLITTLLLKEQVLNGKIGLKKFYIRRALRILPVVFLFLSVLFLLNIIFDLKIRAISFVASFLFMRNLPIPNASDWYTGHFWSLGVEEQFYLFFPFLLTRFSVGKYKKLILAIIILIPVLSYLFYYKVGVFYTNRIIHITSMFFVDLLGAGTVLILIGSYLSILMFTKSKWLSFVLNSNSRYLSLLLFVVAVFIRIPYFLYLPYISDVIFAFLIGIVILLNLKENSYMAKFLNLKLISQIGILSYSLYIWQQIFTHHIPWAGKFEFADSLIFNLGLLIIVGFLSYNFFEKKFLKLKGRFSNIGDPGIRDA
jgi:peptidoglycan/LPS O-acetylase OafA/YrhL